MGSTVMGGSYAMARREILDRIQKYVDPFRVTKGKGFRLNSVDPEDTCGLQLGKGGTIKHVMSGVNPQGCQVFSFKQPSREDLDHDFMWRYVKCLPERGRI